MSVLHVTECANWHDISQVPNDTLPEHSFATLDCHMANDFRNALIWHMDRYDTRITDLVDRTGVSRDVLNKLRGREGSSTTVENAMLIAAFYGKTVNQFITKQDVSSSERLATLFDLLAPEERQLLEAQLQGILSASA